MYRALEWLLGIERIRIEEDAPLYLRWAGDVEAWLATGILLAALGIIILVYRRERAYTFARLIAASCRFALVCLILAVLAQPVLVLQRTRIEPSHIVLLLDTSLSMNVKEHFENESLAQSIAAGAEIDDVNTLNQQSRLNLVVRSFLNNEGAAIDALLTKNGIEAYTFASSVTPQAFVEPGDTNRTIVEFLNDLSAKGNQTRLFSAIDQVIEASESGRLAGIILATDGRVTETGSLSSVTARAKAKSVPIYPLLVGSPLERRDVIVGPIRSLDRVFVSDLIGIEIDVALTGLNKAEEALLVLYDDATGEAVAQESVPFLPDAPTQSVELRIRPTRPGVIRYIAKIEPLQDEVIVENNIDSVEITVLEDQLRVLYVEGYPRYEYRYLKNALVREETIRTSILLLEADDAFVQEGTEPINRFPQREEALSKYDVVLFGDVDPRSGWLSPQQSEMLVDFVSKRGGGFGLIAGERFAPHRYLGTPLEKLICVKVDPDFTGKYLAPITTGYRPALTPEGRQSRIFRFVADRSRSETIFEALPELFWFAKTLGPKPGAIVLAEHPSTETVSGAMPLFVTGRYGAGRIFFAATDDTWLWRRHTGEFLHDTYWIRVIRELAQPERIARDQRYIIRTDKKRYDYGSPVRVSVEFFDSQLLLMQEDTVELVLQDNNQAAVLRVEATKLGPNANIYEGALFPPNPGRFKLQSEHILSATDEVKPEATLVVNQPDLEKKALHADHETLRRLAEATGGEVVPLDNMREAFANIRDRTALVPDDLSEPLWDSRLVLILFLFLIGVEWITRKAAGML